MYYKHTKHYIPVCIHRLLGPTGKVAPKTVNLFHPFIYLSPPQKEAKIGKNRAAARRMQRDQTPDKSCLLYTSPSPRDKRQSRMPSSA